MAKMIFEYQDGPHTDKMILKSYAVGDGALGLNCVRPNDPSAMAAPFKASEADIKRFRDTQVKDHGILKVGVKHPHYRLYTPVERVSENEVKVEGKVYRYEPELAADVNPNVQTYKLFTQVKFGDQEPKEVEVENISTKGSVRFFLRNEEAILASRSQFDNEKAFEYSLSGESRKFRDQGMQP